MKMRIAAFTGMVPRTNPRLLAESAAQRAVNTRLEGGDLVPLCKSKLVQTLPSLGVKTIYRRPSGVWLTWNVDVNAANGPVSEDRTYYTGDGPPKVLFGAGTGTILPLALARPTVPVQIATVAGSPGVAGFGTVTFSGAGPSDGQTITIGAIEYTFRTALSVAPTVPYEILTSATPSQVAANLTASLNGIVGPTVSAGSAYNPLVYGRRTGNTVKVIANDESTASNAIIFQNTTPASNTAFAPTDGSLAGGVNGFGEFDPATAENVYYSYTFVTSLGEESQPAPLSNELLCSALQGITISGFGAPPAGRSIDRYRLYRSTTDSLGATQLYFVLEIPISGFGGTIVHNPADNPIGALIPSTYYDPPLDTLQGLVAGPGGMMAAFDGKDLWFCEPYIPHAWPAIYSLSMDYPIVALASIGSAFVVMTEGTPYLVQGTAPASMVPTKLEQNLPCIAKKGVVDMGFSVVYPSTEGLVSVSAQGAQTLSQGLYSRQDWQALVPSSIVASQHIGHYIFSFLPAGAADRSCTILDLTGAQPWLVDSDEPFTAVFFQLGAGRFFFLKDKRIFEWDVLTEPAKTMLWRSRKYHLPGPVSFGAFLVETDTYDGLGDCAVRVYADGELLYTVTDRNLVERLPGADLALIWEVEYEGTVPVTTLNIATTPTELASQ